MSALLIKNSFSMAKWGEGDPRWIVEERADSHNVNNWHWKEVGKLTRFLSIADRTRYSSDANKWSEKKLKELLEGMVVEDGPYQELDFEAILVFVVKIYVF
jgi:hypothetical protein